MNPSTFATLAVVAGALACGTRASHGEPPSSGGVSNGGGSSASGGTSGAGASAGGAGAEGGADGEPYANVTAVAVTGDPGNFTFAVSVESADIDCTQYADFWEVVGSDGSLLYRRILEHSHTDENGTTDPGAPGNTFTRSGGPVPVLAGETVVVRAHLSTGGYRGSWLEGSAEAGFAATTRTSDFATELEWNEPQPSGCLY